MTSPPAGPVPCSPGAGKTSTRCTPAPRPGTSARHRGLPARFLVWDALDLPGLGQQFDTVLDCGLFHIFEDGDRAAYLDSLASAVRPGGRYFMLCFSDRQPGDWGPRRITEAEIRQSFAEGWEIDAIEGATMDITIDPNGVFAWRSAITRT